MNYKDEAIVWYDLETSGLWFKKHDVIQIAAIATEKKSLEIIEKFECKLQFNHINASRAALECNCYDEKVWETAAVPQNTAFHLFDTFLQKYRTWQRISKKSTKGTVYHVAELGGHNLQFDNEFLREFYRRNGNNWLPASAWRGGCIDTLDIAKTIEIISGEHWEDGFQLGVLCEKFGVNLVDVHDALADVEATIELYKALRKSIILNVESDSYTEEYNSLGSQEKQEMEISGEPLATTEFINDH